MREVLASLLIAAAAGCAAEAGASDKPDAFLVQAEPDAPPGGSNDIQITVDELRFAIVGDTRPAVENDTAGYPTAVIAKIWADVQAESPRPPFAVSTGDYMFASTGSNEQSPQLDAYFSGRQAFVGSVYAALGNHECNGATASNCGTGTLGGARISYVTKNYQQFLDRFLAPIGVTKPWYVVRVASASGAFTAKVVIVAPNAWVDEQAAWLEATMSEPTTYTFVVRHEPASATEAPGTGPSQAIIGRHPYTLLITGHSHKYARDGARAVIVGNGGAPLTAGSPYGYAMIERRSDGNLAFTAKEYTSSTSIDSFVVAPDGSLVP